MTWYQHAENPRYVTSLFPSLPYLQEILVFSVELDREGPRLRLRFNVEEFPDNPPAKWAPEFNQAQLTADFFDVDNLCIKDWGCDNKSRITATVAEGRRLILVQGEECLIRFSCHTFRIVSISGYWNSQK
jgi:hypothetical protein